MVIMAEPTKVKLELMSDEINEIIDELERVPHNIYEFMNYAKLIKKLKQAKGDEDVMVCSIAGCGEIDRSHTAYCLKHGRSPHHMVKESDLVQRKQEKEVKNNGK